VTLDELLEAARAEPVPNPWSRLFWQELERELAMFFTQLPEELRSELTQSALLAVWRKLHRYEPTGPDSLRRWVCAIAAKEILRARPRPSRVDLVGSTLLRRIQNHEGWTPSRQVLAREQAALIEQALPGMTPRERSAIKLLDHQATALAENISVDAARMLLHRAIRKLAKLIANLRKTERVSVITSR
jgi:RNA polymerase sigma factor (sigma-70 family)